MILRAIRWPVLVLLTLVSMSGCATGGDVDESLSLEEAKAYTQDIEREIADSVPPEHVQRVDQQATGTLLPCSRDGGEQWAGGLTVLVEGDPKPSELLVPIAERFASRKSFRVRSRQDNGDELVDVLGHYGAIWIVRYNREEGELLVDSGSPCFRLPDGVWSGGSH